MSPLACSPCWGDPAPEFQVCRPHGKPGANLGPFRFPPRKRRSFWCSRKSLFAPPTSPSPAIRDLCFPLCELGLLPGPLSAVFYITVLQYFIPPADSSFPGCGSGAAHHSAFWLVPFNQICSFCNSSLALTSVHLGRASAWAMLRPTAHLYHV